MQMVVKMTTGQQMGYWGGGAIVSSGYQQGGRMTQNKHQVVCG